RRPGELRVHRHRARERPLSHGRQGIPGAGWRRAAVQVQRVGWNVRIMESPESFEAVLGAHEPTPDPSQEGNQTWTNDCSPPGRGRGWFTLTRNLTLTLRSSIKSRIKRKSKKSREIPVTPLVFPGTF